jgi:spore coat protein JB
MNEHDLLIKIQKYSLALHELVLYLDTHPQCPMALALFEKYKMLKSDAENEYVNSFGPICAEQSSNSDHWDWIDGSWPWERS